MKKYLHMALAVILCLSMTVTAFAGELGEINTLSDTVVPEGEKGRITTAITGKTDSNGILALPIYKNAELLTAAASKGSLQGELQKAETGATKYYLAQFAEKEAEVALSLSWVQGETYKLGKAKTKDSAPGNLKAVAYTMTNTAPIKVGSYVLELAVPQGYEMSSIVDYDPEDDYSIYVKDGYKYGHHTFGELGAGSKAKFTVNVSAENSTGFAIALWAVTILVSAFFLYKNRAMLAQAKEAVAKKKQK